VATEADGRPSNAVLDTKIDGLRGEVKALDRHLTAEIGRVAEAARLAVNESKAAVTKAETATERRLEALNELRSIVADYQTNLLPRQEANTRFTAIDAAISKLEKAVEKTTGVGVGLSTAGQILLGGVAILAVIASIYLGTR
jgi:ribosome-associated translation inhibitor RaiA